MIDINNIKSLKKEIELAKIEEKNKLINATYKKIISSCFKISFEIFILCLILILTFLLNFSYILMMPLAISSCFMINKKSNLKKTIKKSQKKILNLLKKSHKDFFTDEYKINLKDYNEYENNKSEDQKKYDEALKKQTQSKQDINNDFLTKDETMKQIIGEFDVYNDVYKMPPTEIKDDEWDVLFDTIYDIISKKGMQKYYYLIMSNLCRTVYAKALIKEQKNIDINNFIDCLHYTNSAILSKKEIETIKRKIKNEHNNQKAKIKVLS